MFKGLGTWLGFENPTYSTTSDERGGEDVEQGEEEEKVVEAQNEVNKQQQIADQQEQASPTQQDPEHGKGLGGSWFLFPHKCHSNFCVISAVSFQFEM